MEYSLTWVIASAVLSLIFAGLLTRFILKQSQGSDKMKEIAKAIQEGAMAFLHREYKVVSYFSIAVIILLYHFINWQTAVAFLVGAVSSATAGYIGMKIATKANVRTAHAASNNLSSALRIAFSSGAVMGFSVVGFGLLGLTVLYQIFGKKNCPLQ